MNNIMGKFYLALYIFLVHKIVLQFCVFSINIPPVLPILFSHELLLVCVAQPCYGRDSLGVHAFCLGACDLTLVWGSTLSDGRPLEQLVLTGGPKYTACLAWSCTLSVCFAFLMLQAKYWGHGRWASLTNGLITP
jgi:hypothetical protein